MIKFKNKLSGWKRKTIAITLIISLAAISYSFVDQDFKILKNLDIYYTLFRELNLFYVDNTDPDKLVKASIDGMLETLDPYTVYIPESEMNDYKFMTTGEYAGIGALIRKNGNYTTISETYEGHPAYKAGLKVGDIIQEIDGKSIFNKSSSEVSDLLKGDVNTPIELTIQRPGTNKLFKKVLIREKIAVHNVPYYGMVRDNTGYIKLTSFTTDAHLEVKNALINLKEQGAKSIILDLRSNPGGLLMEAVDISNLFIAKDQKIVSTKGKVKEFDNSYLTKNQPVDDKIPLAVLVNHNSASASEIVAGSLQDLDRALIIGQKTFGKGLVQTTRQLSYNTQLKVTTAKYYIPSGRCIQALDYSHRQSNGDVNNFPDSLITKFTTKNGRTVYNAGGINPDISIPRETLSILSINLYSRNYIFNYATEFAMQHDTIVAVPAFNLTDSVYDDFKKYLQAQNFDYKTETEDAFEKFQIIASKEKLLDDAKIELNALSEKIKHDKVSDLENSKEEIEELLKEEIVSRYYNQKGRIEMSLLSDPYVQKAVDILNTKVIYTGLLDGTIKNIYADSRDKGNDSN